MGMSSGRKRKGEIEPVGELAGWGEKLIRLRNFD
jgi:hypothetical protein